MFLNPKSSVEKKSRCSRRNVEENGIWAFAWTFRRWRWELKKWDFLRSGDSSSEKKQAFLQKFPGNFLVSEMGFRFLTWSGLRRPSLGSAGWGSAVVLEG